MPGSSTVADPLAWGDQAAEAETLEEEGDGAYDRDRGERPQEELAPRGEDTCGEQEDAAEDAADAADGERHEVERVPLPPG